MSDAPMSKRERRALRSMLRNRSGAAALEFAIVAPVFLALIFSTFEVAWFYFVNSGLDAAATSAARDIRTGQAYMDGYTSQGTRDLFLQEEICTSLRFMSAAECAANVTVEVREFPTYAALAADTTGFTCRDDTAAAQAAVPFLTGTDRSIIRVRLCMLYQTLNPLIGVSLARGSTSGQRRVTNSFIVRVEPDAST